MSGWQSLDVAALLSQKTESTVSGATTSANVGAFEVPLGAPRRRIPDEDPPRGGYQSVPDWMMVTKD